MGVPGYVWVTVSPLMNHKEHTITNCYSLEWDTKEYNLFSFCYQNERTELLACEGKAEIISP